MNSTGWRPNGFEVGSVADQELTISRQIIQSFLESLKDENGEVVSESVPLAS